jgi:hypothetical protein
MTITFAKQAVAVALYVLGGIPINTHKDLYQPARVHPRAEVQQVRDTIGPGLWDAPATPDIRLNTYIYHFDGLALFKGKPIAGAKVILHVTTSRTVEVRQVVTGDDGSYEIVVNLEGSRNEPVDWQMTAYTPDMKKVELVGRRIAMREDNTVTVHKNLELLSPEA